METLLSLIVSGLALGAIYAFAGLGFVFTFRSIGTFNFFHGELAMVAAVTAVLIVSAGIPVWMAVLAGIACGIVVALLGDALILKRLDSAPELSVILATAAFGIFVLRGTAEWIFGPEPRGFEPLIDGTLTIGSFFVTAQELLILGVFAAVLLWLTLMFRYTQIGRAMRAIGDNPFAARVIGIDLRVTRALALGLAGLLGGIGGILFAPLLSVSPEMGAVITLKAFAVALVGGLTSFRGAVVVGLMLGAVETVVAYYAGSEIRDLIAFGVMMLALLLFPSGALAPKEARRV